MKNKQIIRKHILCILLVCFLILFLNLLSIGCPFFFLFNSPCPTCGVTRALIALIRLDFSGYAHYNAMATPLLFAVWIILHAKLFKRKKVALTIGIVILIINFIYYLLRF